MSFKISKKINNQAIKLNSWIYKIKLKRFKQKLRNCGEGVQIQFPVRFEGPENIFIGNRVSINAFVHIWGHGGVTIGNDCLIASHVSITSLTHDKNAAIYNKSIIAKEIKIGNNVWIGTHAVILPGVTLGDNAIIGAGAVVTSDVPSNTTVMGVPAKPYKLTS